MVDLLADEVAVGVFRAALLLVTAIIESAEVFVSSLFRMVKLGVDTRPKVSAVTLIVGAITLKYTTGVWTGVLIGMLVGTMVGVESKSGVSVLPGVDTDA